MLDVHPPHSAPRSWADFFIHIATITIGLLIAIGLEQTVEFLHHGHQRQELVAQLHAEALRNRDLLRHDIGLESQQDWFLATRQSADHELAHFGQLSFTTPMAPCVPGRVGVAASVYIAPVDGVWTTARESNLVYLMPADEAHFYVRLSHNFDLLLRARDNMADACERVLALQSRFAKPSPDNTTETWSLTADQAGRLADASAAADTALRALVARATLSLALVDYGLRDQQDFTDLNSALLDIAAVPAQHRDASAAAP
jgi:hypothetical protein